LQCESEGHVSHLRSAIGCLVVLALAACAAVLIPASAIPTRWSISSASASTGVRDCVTSRLVVWLDTRGSGAAGSSYYTLELTNFSGHVCSLEGYPGVSGVGIVGRQLGSAASRDRVRAVRRITLRNHATATATLRIVDTANYPNSRCHRLTAAGLRVYPPNQRVSKVIPFPFKACSRKGPVYLSVEAIR
jgi:Domain of unknown function (DUF4232)